METPPPIPVSAPNDSSLAHLPKKVPASATAALILGVLGITCLSVFAGIPALILGILGNRNIAREPNRLTGKGLAIAGIVLGSLSLVCAPIYAGFLLPVVATKMAKSESIKCSDNLQLVGMALRRHAVDHGGKFPDDLQDLSPGSLNKAVLTCPGGKHQDLDYYAGGKTEAEMQGEPILECPFHNHTVQGDGSVERSPLRRSRR